MADSTVPITAGVGTPIRVLTGLGAGSGDQQVITLADQYGNLAHRPFGPLRVSQEEQTLFLDTHDQALDTTNRWVAPTGANAPSVANSVLSFAVATTASAFGKLTSSPSFSPLIPGFLQPSFAIKLDPAGAAATGGSRFWGIGTSPATPATTSAATKLTDAIGWELDTDGKLYAVVYAAGVRTAIDLSASGAAPGTSAQPLDGAYHRYLMQIRTDRIYWFIDGLSFYVATMSFTTPTTQTLPILLQTINPAAGVAAGGYPLTVQGSVVADTASNGSQLSDGTYPWRKAQVDSSGRQAVILPDVVATGNITATDAVVAAPNGGGTLVSGASTASSYVFAACPGGDATWVIQVTGTLGGTIYFEGSMDSTTGLDGNWTGLTQGRQLGLAQTTTFPYFTQTAGIFSGSAAGFKYVRARSVAGVAPNAAVVIRVASAPFAAAPATTSLLGTKQPLDVNMAMATGAYTQVGQALSTVGSLVSSTAASAGCMVITLTGGTYTALTIVFEASDDNGTNWYAVAVNREDGTGSVSSESFTAATSRMWSTDVSGFSNFRVRCTAITATVNPTVRITPALQPPPPSQPVVAASAGIITSPALAVTSFTVLAANIARKGATFYNDSVNVLYLALAAAASTTSYTVQIPPGGYYELPATGYVYSGIVTGISTVASGNVRVTELT